MGSYKEKLEKLRSLLEEDERICLETLREICATGIPNEEKFRPLCWRLLLDYLPVKRSQWTDFLDKQREVYAGLVTDLIARPGTENNHSSQDHPLNPNPDSAWLTFFRDNEILLQIDKDVRRLCPEISFFQQATEFPSEAAISEDGKSVVLCERVENSILESQILLKDRSGAANLVSSRKLATEVYKSLEEGREAHWQVVERILFIYSKLNPGVKYVQGMNEILGPIYYVFASDPSKEWRQFAEPDAYFCFQNLMSEIKDNFIKTLDRSSVGIESTMTRLYELLEEKDGKLFIYLNHELKLLPQYYAFRWLSLLLSQEFLLPDLIRIWDSLFADSKRFQFLLYVCLAMLISARCQLIDQEFSVCMKLLQLF